MSFVDLKLFKLYGRTWYMNVKRAGITYWVLAVPDVATAEAVTRAGINRCVIAERIEIDNVHGEFNWGSKSWQLTTWQKVITNEHIAQLGFNIVQSDQDVVWLQDPLHYFLHQFTLPDYMVSLDPVTTHNSLGDIGPETQVTISHYMNTGVYFLRNTTGGRKLIETWVSIRKKFQDKNYHDQDGLYNYFRESGERIDRPNRVTYVLQGQVKLAQLPVTQFQNSYTHTVNFIHKVHDVKPYAVHFVWTYGNNLGKMHRMRESMYFHDPPSYYRSPRFITIEMPTRVVPRNFDNWISENMVQYHLATMKQQLAVLYYGFALAYALNRTLILPKMQCFCIHNWFESPQCRLPGEPHTKFPLICPADFIFDMPTLYDLTIKGQKIGIREYSFLDNPRTSALVKDNIAEVDVHNDTRCKDCVQVKQRTILIPPNRQGDDLAALLKAHDRQRVLHFRNPTQALVGFGSAEVKYNFDKLMQKLPLKWCCRIVSDVKNKKLPEGEQLEMSIPSWVE